MAGLTVVAIAGLYPCIHGEYDIELENGEQQKIAQFTCYYS